MRSLIIAPLVGVAWSLESPGLEKCVHVDGSEAYLAACDGSLNQQIRLYQDGVLGIPSNDGHSCLEAKGTTDNSLVYAVECDPGGHQQHWILTKNGNIQLENTNQCLDVKAEQKADGTYETWSEIQAHDTVPLQIYHCHEECTNRVNQLWTFSLLGRGVTTNTETLHAYGGHLVSPGLHKCMTAVDGKAELIECEISEKQRYDLMQGHIVFDSHLCLEATACEANADVSFVPCQSASLSGLQQWSYNVDGNFELECDIDAGDEDRLCLDIKAEQKADGSYENWEEIKSRPVNEIHVYKCHEHDSERVNQLWEWSPIGEDELVAIQQGPGCDKEPTVEEPDHIDGHHHHHHHHPSGSMPEDEEEALDLEVEGLVREYAVGQRKTKSFGGTAAAVAAMVAAVLVVGLYKVNAARIPVEQAESQLLHTCE